MLLVTGYSNAKIDLKKALLTFSTDTNRNSQLLSDLVNQSKIFIATQITDNGILNIQMAAKLNLITDLVNRNGEIALRTAYYNTFKIIDSDHRVISCKCMISYQQSKSCQKYSIKHINWRVVFQDNDLQDKYVVAVHNRYQILMNETFD